MSDSETPYERGHRQGSIDALLTEHGLHLSSINGSMDKTADKIGDLVQALNEVAGTQRAIIDRLDAAEATRIATAAALKEQEEARRDKSADAWTPLQRTIAVIGVIGVIGALVVGWLTLAR